MGCLGAKRAFEEHSAEFGRMQAAIPGIPAEAATTPRLRLFLGALAHRACVTVNERGTEAAAVTAAECEVEECEPEEYPPTFCMVVDRPFLFVVREVATRVPTNAILFLTEVEGSFETPPMPT